ncbi:hypothetical protein LIER_41625 [Lithospermum erythrorhizon]|uniref:Uncharacterized protein n=1 Tax=Lithospermum erythrorhizon TaxID=34254 RepID=A0AAV3RC16_LITER
MCLIKKSDSVLVENDVPLNFHSSSDKQMTDKPRITELCVAGSEVVSGKIEVEASPISAPTIIDSQVSPGIFSSEQDSDLELVQSVCNVQRSEIKLAQIEADFGPAKVPVDAENGHTSEVAELDYIGLELDVNKVTQTVLETQTDAAEAMMQQAKQLSAVIVQNDAQAEKSGKGTNHNKQLESENLQLGVYTVGTDEVTQIENANQGARTAAHETIQAANKQMTTSTNKEPTNGRTATPEKGCNFTKVSTPSSWADQIEEEERQKKVPTKKFHVDLPIDFDPMMCNKDDATEEMSCSQLISGSIKLVARRSVSPVGRSSEKLKKLRNRVDFLDHHAGKETMLDKEEYLQENEEFFKAVYHRPYRGRDYH